MKDWLKRTLVEPGSKVDLSDHAPDDDLGLDREDAEAEVADLAVTLADLGTRLAANHRQALLVVLQGMDASGKDGAVKHVLGAFNPMGLQVTSFKAPTATELAHDFLWRVHAACPPRGMVGIFNRSHYEDVLVVRVEGLVPEDVWKARYDAINAFERSLVAEGTTIVKLHLHISPAEQAERFRERLADPSKNWKFSPDDLEKRKKWDAYMEAYRVMLERTSTEWAPWYVVPADRKWVRNWVASKAIERALDGLHLEYPELPEAIRDLKVE